MNHALETPLYDTAWRLREVYSHKQLHWDGQILNHTKKATNSYLREQQDSSCCASSLTLVTSLSKDGLDYTVVANQFKLLVTYISRDVFLILHSLFRHSVARIQVLFLLELRLMKQGQSETLLVIVIEGKEVRASCLESFCSGVACHFCLYFIDQWKSHEALVNLF